MEFKQVSDLDLKISRVTLGTWAIGGWMWGGSNDQKAIDTVITALDKGVTTIDTAPVYGFGKSEELVGKAVKEFGHRDDIQIATKVGLQWNDEGEVTRNSSRDRILKEIDDSLERLKVDYIDIYQIHWPDTRTDFEETASTMNELLNEGKIRAIGVSNFSPEHMDAFRETAPIHICQPPYNLFERGIEKDVLPYCKDNNITLLTYGALCRGLLSGKMDKQTTFNDGDMRKNADPKFQGETFRQHLKAVDRLKTYASESFNRDVLPVAVRWILEKGVESAIWGARKPEQVTFEDVFGWKMTNEQVKEIEEIVENTVEDPVSPAFMAPPE